MRGNLLTCVVLLGCVTPAWAMDGDWSLLKRAKAAGNHQPLNGTYLHQVNALLETFHLSRTGSGDSFVERRSSLDGAPREVVRHAQSIVCYAQDKKSLNAAKISAMRLFPDVLSDQLDDVAQSYSLKRIGQDRVAQRDCTLLELHPKDKQRFSVRLCIDHTTALPLKMVTRTPRGETVEQYTFTELELVAPKDKDQLKPQYKLSAPLVFQPPSEVVASSAKVEALIDVEGLPAGFRLLRSVQRSLGVNDKAVRHMVFSDGLVMLSLFVEQVPGDLRTDKVSNLHGAIGIATLTQPGQQLTLVGDMPESMLGSVIKSVRIIRKS